MAFVPGYRHDVFVSYAHVDDIPLGGAEKGWVTTLIGNLETFLRRKLGDGAQETSIWMDYELSGNQPFPGNIEEALRGSATLLVILSPGYLASPWCGRERDTFSAAVRDRIASGSRIFRVESDEIALDSLPEPFRELLGYRFWARERDQRAARTLGLPLPIPGEPSGQLYFDRLLDLAQELSDELKRLKVNQGAEAQRVRPAPSGNKAAPAVGPAIVLAETTDDLEPQRDELRRYVQQAGIRVLPETYYPRDDLATFCARLGDDLAYAVVFVQLLSDISGRKPDGAPSGYPGIQHEAAVKAKIETMRWRPSGLGLEQVRARDEAYARLLAGADVRECGLEEFKKAVVDRVLRPPPPAPPARSVNGFQILIGADLSDRDDATNLCGILDEAGEFWIRPNTAGDPARTRRSLEQALAVCDALLLLYGKTDTDWVAAQIIQARRALSQRETPLAGMAVIELPPEVKEAIEGTSLRGVHRLDCRKGLDPAVIAKFLSDLRLPA
jgi:hypothetical protein